MGDSYYEPTIVVHDSVSLNLDWNTMESHFKLLRLQLLHNNHVKKHIDQDITGTVIFVYQITL